MMERAYFFLLMAAAPFLVASDFYSHIKSEEGTQLYRHGKVGKARDAYEKALRAEPDSPEIAFNLANVRHREEFYEKSLELFQKISQSSPNATLKSKAHYNAGNNFYRLGELDRAIESYKETLRLDPADEDAKYNLEFLLKRKEEKKKEEEKKESTSDKEEKPKAKSEKKETRKPEGDEGKETSEKKETEKPKSSGTPEETKKKKSPKTDSPELISDAKYLGSNDQRTTDSGGGRDKSGKDEDVESTEFEDEKTAGKGKGSEYSDAKKAGGQGREGQFGKESDKSETVDSSAAGGGGEEKSSQNQSSAGGQGAQSQKEQGLGQSQEEKKSTDGQGQGQQDKQTGDSQGAGGESKRQDLQQKSGAAGQGQAEQSKAASQEGDDRTQNTQTQESKSSSREADKNSRAQKKEGDVVGQMGSAEMPIAEIGSNNSGADMPLSTTVIGDQQATSIGQAGTDANANAVLTSEGNRTDAQRRADQLLGAIQGQEARYLKILHSHDKAPIVKVRRVVDKDW